MLEAGSICTSPPRTTETPVHHLLVIKSVMVRDYSHNKQSIILLSSTMSSTSGSSNRLRRLGRPLLLLHKRALESSEIFQRLLFQVSCFRGLANGGNHLPHLRFRVDVWAGTCKSIVSNAAEVAVFGACDFERTAAEGVNFQACHAQCQARDGGVGELLQSVVFVL